jgi:putative membrane protein
MSNLTRALLIAALSAPLAVSAQNPPSPTDPPKAGDPSRPGDPSKPADAPSSDSPKQAKLSQKELQIMAHYHGDNLMEIELGKRASKTARTEAVKTYGEMLVKDHSDFDKQLTGLAKDMGQTIPKERPETAAARAEMAKMKQTAAKVKKLSGARFEREYLSFMVEDHHHALSNIDAQITETQNTQLADMLREVKPILQRHHDEAVELQKNKAQAMK